MKYAYVGDRSLLPVTTPSYSGSIPENYDRYLGPYIFELFALDVVARVPVNPSRVLEIACGTGRVTAHLRKALPAADIVATDINPDMLAVARRRVENDDIDWQQADVQHLPFDDSQFDVVVCQFGLMFVPDQAKALREVHRVLRPGGKLLLGTWDRLDSNPSFSLANRHVAAYFPEEPPRFFYLPFSLYDEALLLAMTGDAGFGDACVKLVSKTCTGDSAAK